MTEIPWHAHRLASVSVVLHGGYVETIGRRERQCRDGLAVSHPAGEGHSNRHGDAEVGLLTVSLPEDSRFDGSKLRCLRCPIELRSNEISWLATGIARELANEDVSSELAIAGLSFELLACIERLSNMLGTGGKPRGSGVDKVADFILSDPLSRRSMCELASIAGVHASHLAKAFRSRYGTSVGDFARRARLRWAREALASSDKDLAVVAIEAGFADQSHFSRCFKSAFGIPPGRWRDLARSTRSVPI